MEEENREVEEYTIGLIRKAHPEWAAADDTCQQCWDFYQKL
jgi:hypothetical protein